MVWLPPCRSCERLPGKILKINAGMQGSVSLTHWGRVTHICVGKITIIGSDNGLSPCQRQAIIWTNAGILLIGPLGTNFSEILIGIQTFSFKKLHLKTSSAKWRLFCLGLNELSIFTLKMWDECNESDHCKLPHMSTITALIVALEMWL